MRCDDCREALGAVLDDELAPDARAEVETHLLGCAECAAERARLLEVRRAVRDALPRYTAPDVLAARIRGELARGDERLARDFPAATASRWRPLTALAALAAGVVIAVVSSAATAGVMRARAARDDVQGELVASHIRSLMPGHLTDVVTSDRHTVKPWFDGRVDLSPAVPELAARGFPLVGGRLDYVGGRAVPVVVYARGGHVINVYSWPAATGAAPPAMAATRNGYHLVTWSGDGVAHWAVSDVEADTLAAFARAYAAASGGA